MHHQCTELPPSKVKRKQKPFRSRQDNHRKYSNEEKQRVPQTHKKYENYQAHASHERCTNHGDSQHIEGLDVQLVSTNAEIVTGMVTSVSCATRREKYLTRKGLWSQDHPKHINFRLA